MIRFLARFLNPKNLCQGAPLCLAKFFFLTLVDIVIVENRVLGVHLFSRGQMRVVKNNSPQKEKKREKEEAGLWTLIRMSDRSAEYDTPLTPWPIERLLLLTYICKRTFTL